MRYVMLLAGLCVLGFPGLGAAHASMHREVVRSVQPTKSAGAVLGHVASLKASRYAGALRGGKLGLDVKHSAMTSIGTFNTDGLVAFGIGFGVLAGAGFLAVMIGNIVVAVKKGRSQKGWGIAGIVVGALGTVGTLPPFIIGLAVAAVSGAVFALVMLGPLIVSIGLLGLGIHNVVAANRRWATDKKKDLGKDILGFAPVVLPWFNVGKSGDVQGGLALCSSF